MIELDRLSESLQNLISNIVYHESVESTNRTARELVLNKTSGITLVLSETQTHGRGRHDRRWISPKGGLYMSLLLKPKCDAQKYTLFNLLAGCAVCQSIRELYGLNALLKWPNDVLINSKKVAGILSEVFDTHGTMWIVVGIGVNVNQEVAGFPANLRNRITTLQEALQQTVDLNQLIITIIHGFYQRLVMLETGNHNAILNEWRKMNATLGKHVTVVDGGNVITGVALDITKSGALLIEVSPHNIMRVDAGDVVQQINRGL